MNLSHGIEHRQCIVIGYFDTMAVNKVPSPGEILRIRRTNGRKTTELCSAYIMHEDRLLGKPDMDYFRLIDQGYAQYGFDLSVLDEGLAASIGKKAAEEYIRKYLNQEVNREPEQEGSRPE